MHLCALDDWKRAIDSFQNMINWKIQNIMIYRVRRFYSDNSNATTEDIQINPAEANKFKIGLQRLTSSMGNSNEDPIGGN